MVRLPPWYSPVMRHWSKYWATPPVRGQIDILLSFSTTIMFWAMPPMLLSASNTIPLGNAPSPMTATACRSFRPSRSSPALRPLTVLTLHPAWPVMNRSYSLSPGWGKPISPPRVRIVWNWSYRPVMSLCG